MITEWIFDVVTCLKNSTSQDEVSNKLSTCKIVLGKGKLDYDIGNITPLTYHQVYVGTTNNQNPGALIVSYYAHQIIEEVIISCL